MSLTIRQLGKFNIERSSWTPDCCKTAQIGLWSMLEKVDEPLRWERAEIWESLNLGRRRKSARLLQEFQGTPWKHDLLDPRSIKRPLIDVEMVVYYDMSTVLAGCLAALRNQTRLYTSSIPCSHASKRVRWTATRRKKTTKSHKLYQQAWIKYSTRSEMLWKARL